MMNPVLILTRNNLELTKRCVNSVWRQDIDVDIMLIDNGSHDGTASWLLHEYSLKGRCWPENHGVSRGWNCGIGELLDDGADHVLVLNNDVVLPRWFYRTLLTYDPPFVTGVAIDTMPHEEPGRCPLSRHPDFSAFLIRRECWEKLGPFDERMVLYSSDQDYHLRGWFAGVEMMKANVPFFHINSQTLKRATPEEAAAIQAQANKDRSFLFEKWGVPPGGAAYEAMFTSENFGSRRVDVPR